MKITKLLSTLAAGLLMLGLNSCKDDVKLPDPVLTLGSPSVAATSVGGAMEMEYMVENPVQGELPVATSTDSWVKGITVTDNKISFTVEANSGITVRETKVEVTYKKSVAEFAVRQTPAFQITPDEIGYDVAYMVIKPETETMTYMFDMMRKADYDSLFTNEREYFDYITDYVREFLANGNRGYTFEEWLALGGATMGEQTVVVGNFGGNKPLDTNTEYYVIAFGISLQGELTTNVCKYTIKTLPVPASDNQISVEVKDLKAYGAKIATTVTKSEDPYIMFVDKAANWEGLSDAEVMSKFITASKSVLIYYYAKNNGEFPLPVLASQTDYVAFAFGMNHLTPTTALIRKNFTTPAPTPTDVTAKLVYTKFFDKNDYDPLTANDTWAYLPTWVETEGEVASFKYYVQPTYDLSGLPDATLLNAVMSSSMSAPQQLYTIKFGYLTIASVGFDKDGNPGQLYRMHTTLSAAGCSPSTEFNPKDWSPESLKVAAANLSSFMAKMPSNRVFADIDAMMKQGPQEMR